jgi:3-dehydroquinate synthase
MVCASEIDFNLKLLSRENLNKIINTIKLFRLPHKIKGINLSKIIPSLIKDKKFIRAKNRFVLPTVIGKVKVIKDIPEVVIRKAILKHILPN